MHSMTRDVLRKFPSPQPSPEGRGGKRGVLLIAVLLLSSAWSLGASPELQFTLPRSGQRGTEADIVVQGNRLGRRQRTSFLFAGHSVTSLTPVDAAAREGSCASGEGREGRPIPDPHPDGLWAFPSFGHFM